MAAPSPKVFPHLVRMLNQWNELARSQRQMAYANAFKAMARQAGPDDLEPLLDEILTLWQEMRRGKAWELADNVRNGLHSLPGLVIEDKGGGVRWRFVDVP